MPDKETAEKWAALEVERWLNWTASPDTVVYESELVSLTKGPPSRDHEFAARGALNDSYYCGHAGWD